MTGKVMFTGADGIAAETYHKEGRGLGLQLRGGKD
jgi:hypothetical protein